MQALGNQGMPALGIEKVQPWVTNAGGDGVPGCPMEPLIPDESVMDADFLDLPLALVVT